MDLLAGSGCEVEEFLLSSDPAELGSLNGASLAELQLGSRSGALVLAIVPPKPADNDVPKQYRGSQYSLQRPELLANPGSDTRLAPGQMLVVMGSQEQLDRFTSLLGTALKSVDVMST